jgi:hypothetical protein
MNFTENPDLFIERCIAALGGLDALHGAKTIHIAVSRQNFDADGNADPCDLDVYRAFGGRIRIEERFADGRARVFVLNGYAGYGVQDGTRATLAPEQLEAVKRGVRLYPRNFLAHADEHQYCAPVADTEDGTAVYRLALPAENVVFSFDAETFLCRLIEDTASGFRNTYENYSEVHGILTPMRERRFHGGRLVQEDVIARVEYNVDLDDALFNVG